MARVDIKLGYSCNDACVHCVVDDHRDVLRARGMAQDQTTEEFQAQLQESRARADTVIFTGGEPTIRADLPILLAYARDLGYRLTMQSNGRRFSDPDFADQITAIAPVVYCIALHGPTADVHDAVTRRSGSFSETVAGLRNLVARRQEVTGKIVLSRLNCRVLPDTARCFVDLGIRHVSIAFPHAQGTARKLWDLVVPTYRDVIGPLHAALDTLNAAGASADAESFMYCHMEGYEHYIAEIRQQLEDYVELHQYGDLEARVDWSLRRREIKSKFTACAMCRFDPICEGPWQEYAERCGGDEFRPILGRRVHHVREILDGSFRVDHPFLDALPTLLG